MIEPNIFFRFMVWGYALEDLFRKPGKQLESFDIKPGHTIVDYGCGPGRYLKRASEMVGGGGKVYAVDVHPMALVYSERRITKLGLTNVETALVKEGRTSIENSSVDRIFAIDMFHHVDEPKAFLEELSRIAGPDCKLFIYDTHQSEVKTRSLASTCDSWKARKEGKNLVEFDLVRDEEG
jgi:cyclopropane fatty-acyl-phospholipid synthase-like methyltransferase